MKISIKGSPIAIISSLSDAGVLYLLSKKTTLKLKQSIYISSTISILIAFIGNFYWTFKSDKIYSRKENLIKLIKFIIFQIIMLIITSEITILIIEESCFTSVGFAKFYCISAKCLPKLVAGQATSWGEQITRRDLVR